MEISNTVVIPAAGLGTRFLPFTKSVPKEMLPILNKPAIQYVIEECVAATVQNFYIITNRSKKTIADYVDMSTDLEHVLQERSQEHLLSSLSRLTRNATFAFIRQCEPLGPAHALSLIRNFVGKDHFCVALPDELIEAPEPALKQLICVARQEKASIIAVQEIPASEVSDHTMLRVKKTLGHNLYQIGGLVHRPHPKDAPSNLAVVGRFVLSPKIFQSIDYLNSHSDEYELSLHSALNLLAQGGNERVFAYKIEGTRHHLTTPISWLRAVLSYGLKHPQHAAQMQKLLAEFSANPVSQTSFMPATSIEKQLEL